MKLRALLLGSLAIAGLGSVSAMPDDGWIMPSFAFTGGGGPSRHRSPGGRAHRCWRKARSAGRR